MTELGQSIILTALAIAAGYYIRVLRERWDATRVIPPAVGQVWQLKGLGPYGVEAISGGCGHSPDGDLIITLRPVTQNGVPGGEYVENMQTPVEKVVRIYWGRYLTQHKAWLKRWSYLALNGKQVG